MIGKTMAQGTSVIRPANSPFIKLPILPKNNAIGANNRLISNMGMGLDFLIL
tara:strand:+ start:11770 stop:11925 length:156 start_codon:yes stop_codon:yes gene_type:complete